jgi:hypothetical protein
MSNVIKLATSRKAKTKAKPSTAATDEPLIRECIAFAQNVAAFAAGFAIDPTDSEYAEPMGSRFSTRYLSALFNISKMSALTLEGLQAKARVLPIIIKNAGVSEHEDNFFKSFAVDVDKLLQPIIEERCKAEDTAEELKAKAVQS